MLRRRVDRFEFEFEQMRRKFFFNTLYLYPVKELCSVFSIIPFLHKFHNFIK